MSIDFLRESTILLRFLSKRMPRYGLSSFSTIEIDPMMVSFMRESAFIPILSTRRSDFYDIGEQRFPST